MNIITKMEEKKELKVIDLGLIFNKIWANKNLFIKILPITFILACAYILCIPRTYQSSLTLAPEVGSSSGMGGALGSLASSFGFDLSSVESTDAINPMLYPDLMHDNGFVAGLFDINVQSKDGDISCKYYDYLYLHQKYPFWTHIIVKIKKLFAEKETENKKGAEFNPYMLNKRQNSITSIIRDQVHINVDKKTAMISIDVEAQDPLICKTLCDSVKQRLQTFITNYRTNKARNDEMYYKNLMDQAKAEYEDARRIYGSFADSNQDVVLESYRAKQNDLENDMQLKYNTYTTLLAQYQATKAKVQERTPAFTVVQGASVPLKPSGPKRMIFVIIVLFLATLAISIYSIKDIILQN